MREVPIEFKLANDLGYFRSILVPIMMADKYDTLKQPMTAMTEKIQQTKRLEGKQ